MAQKKQEGTKGRVWLVDGSGFIFRAYHSLPPLTRKDGTPVGAVYGFTNMMLKLLEKMAADREEDYVAVIFDAARKNFRNDLYAEYKANRPDAPEDLIPQFPLVREATRALNIPALEVEGFEADDLIATYAKQARATGLDVVVVSSDKDLMQLVGEGVAMYDAMKDKHIGEAEVVEKFGVGPALVADALALMGDASDNVPGVPGIGPKTAAELLVAFGGLEGVLARAGEIKQNKRRETIQQNAEIARLSRKLVALADDAPVPEPLENLRVRALDTPRLVEFLRAQDFKSLATRMEQKLPSPSGRGQGEGIHDVRTSSLHPNPLPEGEGAIYTLIQDTKTLETWIAKARAAGRVAFDTETTSLNPMQAELVGFSLSLTEGEACYVPVGHKRKIMGLLDDPAGAGGASDRQVALAEALPLLKSLLEDEAVLKIGQNIKYDMRVMQRYAVDVTPIDDTMVLSYVLDAGLHGHGMDELSKLHLEITPISYDEVTGTGKNRISFAEVALDKACVYAAEDADITLRLYNFLKSRLVSESMVSVYETLDRPLVPILAAMEREGIKVDRQVLQHLSKDFSQRIGEIEQEAWKLAGKEFNLGSPAQLGVVLFEEMGIQGGKKGKSGAYSTGADVLESLAAEGVELAQKLLDWRQLSKLKSTYTDALQEAIDPKTGRVHTSFSQVVTSTGRLSSSEPNVQNIPIRTEEGKKIRRAFVAEKGCKLISADYSQIELRLLAEMAGIDVLKQAFREGKDIHAITAASVFGVPEDQVDSDLRRRAKTINFGIIYGMSAHGLSVALGISRGEAAAYIEAYFKRYPGIREYMDRTIAFAREHGYVCTLYGRKCYARGITSKNPSERNFAERAAINAPLQGTAADIIKRAMLRMPEALRQAGLSARMLLQVHDELLFEAPEAEAEKTAATLKRVMESASTLSLPMTVQVGIGDNWEESH